MRQPNEVSAKTIKVLELGTKFCIGDFALGSGAKATGSSLDERARRVQGEGSCPSLVFISVLDEGRKTLLLFLTGSWSSLEVEARRVSEV